jgi:hypothetical protein
MAKDTTILSDFHKASSDSHPANSLGNNGIFNDGSQIGSVEYMMTPNGVDVQINNTKSNRVD